MTEIAALRAGRDRFALSVAFQTSRRWRRRFSPSSGARPSASKPRWRRLPSGPRGYRRPRWRTPLLGLIAGLRHETSAAFAPARRPLGLVCAPRRTSPYDTPPAVRPESCLGTPGLSCRRTWSKTWLWCCSTICGRWRRWAAERGREVKPGALTELRDMTRFYLSNRLGDAAEAAEDLESPSAVLMSMVTLIGAVPAQESQLSVIRVFAGSPITRAPRFGTRECPASVAVAAHLGSRIVRVRPIPDIWIPERLRRRWIWLAHIGSVCWGCRIIVFIARRGILVVISRDLDRPDRGHLGRYCTGRGRLRRRQPECLRQMLPS